jgi:hypothetical protein
MEHGYKVPLLLRYNKIKLDNFLNDRYETGVQVLQKEKERKGL